MLKIGDFSKLSRISIRMLRYYDEMQLLVPDLVDSFTGYRYYSETQLPLASEIQALKGLGFGLAVIKEIIGQKDNPQAMEHFLLIKKKELEEESEKTRQMLKGLDATLNWLRKDGTIMDYNVVLKEMPKRQVASVRQIIPTYECEGTLWKLLQEESAPLHLEMASQCYSLAVFHDEGFMEKNPDVEIQLAVVGNYQDTEHIKFKTVPAVQVASATYKGSYAQIPKVNEAVANWVKENGYRYDGPSFSIYHVSPAQTENPDEYVTEICYPIQKN